MCRRNTRSIGCRVGFQQCKKMLHLLSGEGAGLSLISSRNNGLVWFVTCFSFLIRRFPMDFPTVLTGMARLVAKITPNPWSFIWFALKRSGFIIASTCGNLGWTFNSNSRSILAHIPPILFSSNFWKNFTNWRQGLSSNDSPPYLFKLDIKANQELEDPIVFHGLLMMTSILGRFALIGVEEVKVLLDPLQGVEVLCDVVLPFLYLTEFEG